jgi:uncharacterized membrane protein YraQ (UPF0718 family)
MDTVITFLLNVSVETWRLLLDSSVYIIFGIFIAGLLRMFLSPHYVARHLGEGRFMSVIKAAVLGIPIPLCSCGVLPAAASIKKQGANNGATAAFLIATPESGIDSIAISWALLDPIMTVARPAVAFVTAFVAGISENLLNPPGKVVNGNGALSCPVDNCCDGEDCPPEKHNNHHSMAERSTAGMKYAFGELWGDLAGWFLVGIILAGLITAAVPDDLMADTLGGGLGSMLLMLAVGVPLYICATASTPIAAALILKGVSPGAALVFLLVGPATNLASLSVLVGLLGKRATAVYLSSIAVVSVLSGLLLDLVYGWSGVNVQAVMGQAGEMMPLWIQYISTALLLVLSVKPVTRIIVGYWSRLHPAKKTPAGCSPTGCCGG